MNKYIIVKDSTCFNPNTGVFDHINSCNNDNMYETFSDASNDLWRVEDEGELEIREVNIMGRRYMSPESRGHFKTIFIKNMQ